MFHQCKSKEEISKLFKRLAKYLHPDAGGEHDLMVYLKESYEMAMQFIDIKEQQESEYDEKKSNVYERTFEDILFGDERLHIIEKMYAYAKINTNFGLHYVDAVANYLERNGKITARHFNALLKVYEAFYMEDVLENDKKGKK